MAKKRSEPESNPQDENVYRVKHISRAAWEEGSVTLPGLPEDAAKPAPQTDDDDYSLDKLDDSIVEMAMTQEISLELIREYLRKEEEQAKQRQLAKNRQRQQQPPPSRSAGYGPIQPDEIEGYQGPAARPPAKVRASEKKEAKKVRAPKAAPKQKPKPKPKPAPKPKPEQPKPEPKPQLPKPEPEISKELVEPKLPGQSEPTEPSETIKKSKPQKTPKPKKEKKTAKKPPKEAPSDSGDSGEDSQKEKKSEKAKKPKQDKNRDNLLVRSVNTIRAYFAADKTSPAPAEPGQQQSFWADEVALYHIPLLDIFDYLYRNIYYFGLRFARPILLVTRYALPSLLHPILALWHLIRAVLLAIHHVTIGRIKRRTSAGKAKHALRLVARKEAGITVSASTAIKELAEDYHTILSAFVNILMPAAALGVLLIVIQVMSRQTYALQVNYNNSNLGYIANEGVFLSAQAIANQHVAPKPVEDLAHTEDSLKTYAQYQLVRVGPEQLTSTDRLTDELLNNATDPMTSACGVYLAEEDGSNSRLIATTKNSTDANWVLENLKHDKSADLTIVEGATVGFVQQVDLVPGFYPESQLTEPDKLLNMLNGNTVGGVPYIMEDDDNLWDVAFRFKIPYDKLLNMNPTLIGQETRIRPGTEILISEEVPVLQLKVVQTERRLIEIPFETDTQEDENMFRGTSRTLTEGENGEEEIYERVTYINNMRQESTVPIGVPRRLKEPVTEVRKIGTRSTVITTPEGPININPSASGFTWPAPNNRTITSPYGMRRGGMHRGVDIAGGNAYGQPVVAAMDGTIEWVGYSNDGFGYNILINHGGGVKTRYAHMINGSSSYRIGSKVGIGRPIGRIGSTGNSTGPHLHFEVIINGNRVNPMNYVRR